MKTKQAAKKPKSAYVRDENPELRKVVRELKSMVKGTVPGTKETVNSWGVPTFEAQDPFCFYMIGKNHVTFGFHFGTSLEDPQRLLEGTGKNLRHVKLRKVEDLERTAVGGQGTHAGYERKAHVRESLIGSPQDGRFASDAAENSDAKTFLVPGASLYCV
jgi:hypothetical protein